MSAIGPVDHFDVSPEKAYFRALETTVLELLGAPLQLSPDDFEVARAWHGEGIPLELVQTTLRQVVERRQTADEERLRRLRYYQRAVSAAWKESARLTSPGERQAAPSFSVEARVARLVAAVERLGPWASPIHQRLSSVRHDAAGADAESVEQHLLEIDAALLERAAEHLDSRRLADIDARVDTLLRPIAARLPAAEAAKARHSLRGEGLRRSLELPQLSLFSLDAAAPAAAEAGKD